MTPAAKFRVLRPYTENQAEAMTPRWNTSYHPRHPLNADMLAVEKKALVLIGAEDEANDPAKFSEIMQTSDQSLQVLDGIKHLNIVCDPKAMQASLDWINLKKTQDIGD